VRANTPTIQCRCHLVKLKSQLDGVRPSWIRELARAEGRAACFGAPFLRVLITRVESLEVETIKIFTRKCPRTKTYPQICVGISRKFTDCDAHREITESLGANVASRTHFPHNGSHPRAIRAVWVRAD